MNGMHLRALVAAPLALALAVTSHVYGQEREKRTVEVTQETTKTTIKFVPQGEADVTGTAVILPATELDQKRVRPLEIELTGLAVEEGQANYPVRLYRGTCATGGAPIGDIGTVAAAEGGTARGELALTEADWKRAAERAEAEEQHAEEHAELAEEKAELEEEHAEEHAEDEDFAEAGLTQSSKLFIQVHAPDGTPVSCANLEGQTDLFVPGN